MTIDELQTALEQTAEQNVGAFSLLCGIVTGWNPQPSEIALDSECYVDMILGTVRYGGNEKEQLNSLLFIMTQAGLIS